MAFISTSCYIVKALIYVPKWLQIKEAAEKTRDAATLEGDEIGELTCSELLEALELSQCLFLMKCE
ncbi:hypothetical protein CsSME_00010221 [Camellia sinensis var. sinensis]